MTNEPLLSRSVGHRCCRDGCCRSGLCSCRAVAELGAQAAAAAAAGVGRVAAWRKTSRAASSAPERIAATAAGAAATAATGRLDVDEEHVAVDHKALELVDDVAAARDEGGCCARAGQLPFMRAAQLRDGEASTLRHQRGDVGCRRDQHCAY